MWLHDVLFCLFAAFLTSRTVQLAEASLTARQKGTEVELPQILKGPRKVDMLANITGFQPLPYPDDVIRNATLNVSDIQCDILVGMKKKRELFYFFTINDPKSFKVKLHNTVVPQITSTFQMLAVATQPIVAVNLAFSQTGLSKLGITDNLNDPTFSAGQFVDANNLGDPGTGNWVKAFTATEKLHGLFLIASDDQVFIDAEVQFLQSLFGPDISNLYSLQGAIRPPPFDGHEMFGFLDGVGQPAVAGFNLAPFPGQLTINAGIILVGEPGDSLPRPSWAKDGSFLAFRQLQQLVPEFDQFLFQNAPSVPGFSQQESADLLGARMVGRWKSVRVFLLSRWEGKFNEALQGTPIDLAPLVDNPSIGNDPNQNNDFDFFHPGFPFNSDQSHCPFDAHIRKTRPRADLNAPFNTIMRAGIPYGPEVTPTENKTGKSNLKLERGLAFVAYQSQLAQGFQFMQRAWANEPSFVFGKNVAPGFDPIIGANHGNPRFMSGYDVADETQVLKLPFDFVISRGGSYLFSPSISALKNVISV
nr:DyP-type peroxidase [Auricularia mesenterica]